MYTIHLPRETGETDSAMARRARTMVGQSMFGLAGIPNGTCVAADVVTETFHRPDPVRETVIAVRFDFEEQSDGE